VAGADNTGASGTSLGNVGDFDKMYRVTRFSRESTPVSHKTTRAKSKGLWKKFYNHQIIELPSGVEFWFVL
jgi:hypothetical protein